MGEKVNNTNYFWMSAIIAWLSDVTKPMVCSSATFFRVFWIAVSLHDEVLASFYFLSTGLKRNEMTVSYLNSYLSPNEQASQRKWW